MIITEYITRDEFIEVVTRHVGADKINESRTRGLKYFYEFMKHNNVHINGHSDYYDKYILFMAGFRLRHIYTIYTESTALSKYLDAPSDSDTDITEEMQKKFGLIREQNADMMRAIYNDLMIMYTNNKRKSNVQELLELANAKQTQLFVNSGE